MLLIHCPYCGEERSELEFRHAGQAHVVRASNLTALSDEEFAGFLYIRDNPKGVVFERWRHIHGCGRFFNASRDTVSDKFIAVYKADEPQPDLSGPITRLDRAEHRERVARALENLAEDHRQVLLLRFFEGLSAEEAGEKLSRSATAVRSLTARALVELGKNL